MCRLTNQIATNNSPYEPRLHPKMSLNAASILKQSRFSSKLNKADPSCSRLEMVKSVSFDKVYIREHALTLGDHPCCSSGAPVSLDWKYKIDHEIVPIDIYERYRNGERRDAFDLVLNVHTRYKLLRFDCGVPINDIESVIKECQYIKEQREKSLARVFKQDERKVADREIMNIVQKKRKTKKNKKESPKTSRSRTSKSSLRQKLLNKNRFFLNVFLDLLSKIAEKVRRLH